MSHIWLTTPDCKLYGLTMKTPYVLVSILTEGLINSPMHLGRCCSTIV